MSFISYINHDKINRERGKNTPAWILIDEIGHYPTVYGKSLRIRKVIYIHWNKMEFWFRLYNGYGINGRNSKAFFSFSERQNPKKMFRIFNWKLKILKPYNKR